MNEVTDGMLVRIRGEPDYFNNNFARVDGEFFSDYIEFGKPMYLVTLSQHRQTNYTMYNGLMIPDGRAIERNLTHAEIPMRSIAYLEFNISDGNWMKPFKPKIRINYIGDNKSLKKVIKGTGLPKNWFTWNRVNFCHSDYVPHGIFTGFTVVPNIILNQIGFKISEFNRSSNEGGLYASLLERIEAETVKLKVS
jgi:hypothetical protein